MRNQIGLETIAAPGTEVTPTRKLESLKVELTPDIETMEDTTDGTWPATGQSIGTEATKGKMEADSLDFNELPILLASVLRGTDAAGTAALAPTTGTADYTWVFEMDADGVNQGQTFTLEKGNDNVGQKAAGVSLADITLTTDPKKMSVSGSLIGGKYRHTSDGDTPTFTAIQTALAGLTGGRVRIDPKNTCIYLSTTSRSALNTTGVGFGTTDTANRLPMNKQAVWKLSGRRFQEYAQRCDLGGSPALTSEDMALEAGSLLHEATDEIMSLMAQLRKLGANDPDRVWVRIENTGPVIPTTAVNYKLTIDFCAYVKPHNALTVPGGSKIVAAEWPMVYALDEAFGGAGTPGFLAVQVVNAQSALLA
jgi:hypothetical protein